MKARLYCSLQAYSICGDSQHANKNYWLLKTDMNFSRSVSRVCTVLFSLAGHILENLYLPPHTHTAPVQRKRSCSEGQGSALDSHARSNWKACCSPSHDHVMALCAQCKKDIVTTVGWSCEVRWGVVVVFILAQATQQIVVWKHNALIVFKYYGWQKPKSDCHSDKLLSQIPTWILTCIQCPVNR